MEKLQPILKQAFWIVFSFALILMLVAWWLTNGELSAAIEKREGEVEQAFKDGTQNVSTVPSDAWAVGGREINDEHLEKYKLSAVQLYRRQLSARTYPAEIAEELGRIPFNSKINDKALREQYAVLYPDYFRSQVDVIAPFEYGKGLVDVSDAQITYVTQMRERPTSPDIWKAQEDIWLVRSILDSVAAVNEGFERIDKAPVRALLKLELRGGDREGGGGTSIAAASTAYGGEFEEYGEEYGAAYGGGFSGGGGVAGATAATGVWSAYEGSLSGDLITEELGPKPLVGGGGEDEGGWEGRYVDDDQELPYRTRAFALNVKIVEQAIPILMAELTNSNFPVEILRVDATFGGAGGRSTGYGGGEYGAGNNVYGDDYSEVDFGGGSAAAYGGDEDYGYGGFGGGFGDEDSGGYSGLGRSFGGGATLGPVPGLETRKRALTAREQKAVTEGKQLLAAGLAGRDLCTLRVAGLMTLYRSQEENTAEIESTAAAEQEAQEVGAQLPAQPANSDASEQSEAADQPTDGGAAGSGSASRGSENAADATVDAEATGDGSASRGSGQLEDAAGEAGQAAQGSEAK